jgi:hypothetical protein
MAEHQLPKLTVRVRFSSPAPRKAAGQMLVGSSGEVFEDRLNGPLRPPVTPRFPPRRSWIGHAEGPICAGETLVRTDARPAPRDQHRSRGAPAGSPSRWKRGTRTSADGPTSVVTCTDTTQLFSVNRDQSGSHVPRMCPNVATARSGSGHEGPDSCPAVERPASRASMTASVVLCSSCRTDP